MTHLKTEIFSFRKMSVYQILSKSLDKFRIWSKWRRNRSLFNSPFVFCIYYTTEAQKMWPLKERQFRKRYFTCKTEWQNAPKGSSSWKQDMATHRRKLRSFYLQVMTSSVHLGRCCRLLIFRPFLEGGGGGCGIKLILSSSKFAKTSKGSCNYLTIIISNKNKIFTK
jgi:hypothetical protein